MTSKTLANTQAPKKLTAAERTAKLLAYKPRSYFNAPITPKSMPGDSALARARAAI